MKNLLKIILIIILIPFAIYFWPASYGGDTTIMMVQGQSMLPTILPGSLVVAKQASEYNVGDIVAYDQKDAHRIVVHRIVEENPSGFIIRGDNNPRNDAGVHKEDVILGTVIFSTPYVGDVISMFRNPVVLILSAAVLFGFQMEQKRRKEKKEKRRCLQLGIPYVPEKLRKAQKKAKKPDYSMFFAAIFINILTFILTQISIENGIQPQGDMITGFLYNVIVPGLASTLIFAFYFGIIFGLFFLAKSYERKINKYNTSSYSEGNNFQRLIQKRKSNPILAIASVGWVLYILMSIFHLMSFVGNVLPIN